MKQDKNKTTIFNYPAKKYSSDVFNDTVKYQKQYGFEIGTGKNATHNNESDAFKHAYMQAQLALWGGKHIAKLLGDIHERDGNKKQGQTTEEENMDQWNNIKGREIAKEIIQEYGPFATMPSQKMNDIIAQKVYEKMQNGELITKPFEDTRSYKDLQKGKPTGQASNIDNIREFTPPYTRGDIKSMTPEEFQYYEKSIMQEVKQGNIIDDPRVKSTFAPEQKEIIFEENPDTDIKTYANKHIYTREEIGKMSTDEYAKHEPAILKQMKEKGIPTKRELEEHRSKTSGKSSNGSNADGRWVTINGNHVLIDK